MTQTPGNAGYRVVEYTDDELIVEGVEDKERELFARAPDGLPGWGLRFRNDDWEFVRSVDNTFTLED